MPEVNARIVPYYYDTGIMNEYRYCDDKRFDTVDTQIYMSVNVCFSVLSTVLRRRHLILLKTSRDLGTTLVTSCVFNNNYPSFNI